MSASAAPDVFITAELNSRIPKLPDYLREKIALQDLARQMVDNPGGVLGLLVEQAMDLTGATSAGLSLYEKDPAPGVFRWHHLCGELARFTGATTPRHDSPCGITLDQGGATLCRHPEQVYSWVADAGIMLEEVLLVPLYVGTDEPLGTLWVTADEEGFFDSGQARVLSELAAFAGLALHMSRTGAQLQAALKQQEQLTREMNHRVKNLFAVFGGLVRTTAKTAVSAKDMALSLTGRLKALSDAHALVRVAVDGDETVESADLCDLVSTLLRPYENAHAGRFTLRGARVALGAAATNALALVFHELATNAAKHGALGVPEGCVNLSWEVREGRLLVDWREENGPLISGAPAMLGFGMTLTQGGVSQLGGEITRDWRTAGLGVSISVPVANLKA